MMFGGLGVLNEFLTYDIFDYDSLSGCSPVTSQGASVLSQSPPPGKSWARLQTKVCLNPQVASLITSFISILWGKAL